MNNKKLIFGGDHSLNLNINSIQERSAFNILKETNKNSLFFRSGRDAFYSIINFLKPNKIWLPNYICDSLWKVSRRKFDTNWYEVNDNLEVNANQIIENCKDNDIVVIIATLGSKSLSNIEYISKSIKSILIVDLTHVVLDKDLINKVKKFSTYQIYSLRKAFPVLDGGLLSSSLNLKMKVKKLDDIDSFLSYRSIGLLKRGTAIRMGKDDLDNIKYLRKAEDILSKGKIIGTKISSLSIDILSCIDYEKSSFQNRKNKKLIYSLIKDVKSFKLLADDDSISLYIPMIFYKKINRDIFREKLRENSIYFPIHWPVPLNSEIKINKSFHLSDKMLSIPCDYRYSESDIKYMCSKLKMIDKLMDII